MPDEKQPVAAKTDVPARPADRFFLVVVSDSADEATRIIECESMGSFLTAVNDNVLSASQTINAYGFKGQRIQISSPTPVCSVEIEGQRSDVGSDDRVFDATGRIVPLRRSTD